MSPVSIVAFPSAVVITLLLNFCSAMFLRSLSAEIVEASLTALIKDLLTSAPLLAIALILFIKGLVALEVTSLTEGLLATEPATPNTPAKAAPSPNKAILFSNSVFSSLDFKGSKKYSSRTFK